MLDEWPSFGVDRLVATLATEARRTRVQALLNGPASPQDGSAADGDAAIARFLEMESEIQWHGDVRMIQGEHLRAWLRASVGPLLLGVTLERGQDADVLTEIVMARLALPFSRELPSAWRLANELEEKRLDLLYNLTFDPTGELVPRDAGDIRVGQGEVWRESWGWLSRDIDFAHMHEAVQLAARIMRCEPVVEGLMRALSSERGELRTVALGVLRRWLLALRSMSWLEASALETWSEVRAQDLACFAFSALKPEWPRRIMSVSHRSADAKPALSTMRLWRSSRCAIDASYVPSWETNTGMIWGLFGATPAIVRVRSPTYADSLWCRREAELAEHLVERRDFLSNRWVLDIDVARVRVLDDAYTVWDAGGEASPALRGLLPEFPPQCEVWTPPPMPVWELAMLRASGALRAINEFLGGDGALVNQFVTDVLLREPDFPGPAPTNNPTGWREYATIFQELQAHAGGTAEAVAITLPAGYGDEEARLDRELSERIPDLSSGAPALRDVLVALEFLRTEWRVATDQGHGRFLALDCRGISREQLIQDARYSLHRGLISLRLPVPLWIIQSAGQGVDGWGLPEDFPIFTEHLEHQFSWMLQISFDRRDAQSNFPRESKLALSPAMQRLCREGP